MAIAAVRFNNPGNVSLPIRGWKGGGEIVGIKGQSGYAKFPDMQTGFDAFKHRVNNRVSEGYDTIRKLNPIYAEDTNWKNGVSRLSGIGLDEPITSQNINKLYGGILQQETGKSPSSLGINVADGTVTGGTGTNSNSMSELSQDTYGRDNALNWETPQTDPRWKMADANGDGDVTVSELKAYNEKEAASKAASAASSGSQGKPINVPVAIVTAANQMSQATASAAKTAADASTANTSATNATNTGIWQGLQTWLGSRLLQIMVFILAAIFVLVGLYFFAPNKTIAIPELPK